MLDTWIFVLILTQLSPSSCFVRSPGFVSVLPCFVLLYMTRFKVRGDKLLKPVWGFLAPISFGEIIIGES